MISAINSQMVQEKNVHVEQGGEKKGKDGKILIGCLDKEYTDVHVRFSYNFEG